MSRFIEICGDLIDMNEVCEVTKADGDTNWSGYHVYFKNTKRSNFYYEGRNADEHHFPRKKFIELLIGGVGIDIGSLK